MGLLPEPNDIFAPVPASYPFEDQLVDNAATLADQQAQNPLPEPFAETIGSVAPTGQGKGVTPTSEPTRTKSQTKGSKD